MSFVYLKLLTEYLLHVTLTVKYVMGVAYLTNFLY